MNTQTVKLPPNTNHFERAISTPSVEIGSGAAPKINGKSRKQKQKTSPDLPAGWTLHGGSQEVLFQFNDETARQVLLAGEFTEWDKQPLALSRNESGNWQVKVRLAPGKYRYRFLVDGGWQDDPRADAWLPNPFGSNDCVMEVS